LPGSDIVFDRDWFHGPNGIEDREVAMMQPFGSNIAFVNSYWDNLHYWYATYLTPSGLQSGTSNVAGATNIAPVQVSSTSFTIAPVVTHYGAPAPATLASTLTVSWTGATTVTSPEIAVYFDMSDVLHLIAPQGPSVTASTGTVS
jgi:hypothetical protein